MEGVRAPAEVPRPKLLTDSDYADIERYCLALHAQLPNVDEWEPGWPRREPALMYLVRYRVWLVVEAGPAKRKGREPKPFITWLREADRKAAWAERHPRRDRF